MADEHLDRPIVNKLPEKTTPHRTIPIAIQLPQQHVLYCGAPTQPFRGSSVFFVVLSQKTKYQCEKTSKDHLNEKSEKNWTKMKV